MKTNQVKKKQISIILITLVALLGASSGFAAGTAYTFNGSSSTDWNTAANWTPNTGVPGGDPADTVIIPAGKSVVVAENHSLTSVTFDNTSTSAATLTVNSPATLTLSGAITLQNAAAANTAATLAGSGIISCATATIGNDTQTTTTPTFTTTLTSTIATLTISGNLVIQSVSTGSGNNKLNNGVFDFQTGTVTVGGNVNYNQPGPVSQSAETGTLTMVNGSHNGSLTVSGTFTKTKTGSSSGTFTFNANATGTSVTLSGVAVVVPVSTYYDLTLNGSGAYTMASVGTINDNFTVHGTVSASGSPALTVSGNLSIGSGATLSIAGVNLNVTGTTTVGDSSGSGTSGTLTHTSQTGTFTLTGAVTVNHGGVLSETAAGAFTFSSDLIINAGGTVTESGGAVVGIAGSFQNNGTFTSGTGLHTFSGTSQNLTGTASIQKATITGTYTVPAGSSFTFSAASLTITSPGVLDNSGTVTASYGSATSIGGNGTLINDVNATLNIASGSTFTFISGGGTLTTSAANNTVNWTTSGKTAAALTYVNLGLTGGGTMSASGSTVTGNLTVGSAVTGALTFPASPIGGTFTYSGSGSSTFPNGFSIGALNQTAGTLAVSASQTLTVTGTGAGTWTRSAGTFTANATSTVKFTGTAPDIGGAAATAFGKLLIDSTATTATASGSGFTIVTALTINPSGQLDISALSGSSLTLGASASLTNSGTIKGSIITGTTGKVFAGTDGGYGTCTIALTPSTGDLNLTSGSAVNLDINTTAAGANDKLVVGGTLTLNSTVFNLKAPSNGATIDTADYTLATAGTISGTPTLNWVTGFVPANTNNYVLVVSGGTLKLHNTSGGPTGSPVLAAVVSGSTLTLSWDSTTFPGYNVEAQTNSASVGLGSNWSDTGSGTVSPYQTTIDPANPAVFFRLAHP